MAYAETAKAAKKQYLCDVILRNNMSDIFKFPFIDSLDRSLLPAQAVNEQVIFGSHSALNSAVEPSGDAVVALLGASSYHVPLLVMQFALLIGFYVLLYRYGWQVGGFAKSAVSLSKSISLIENRSVDIDYFIRLSSLMFYTSLWATAFYGISNYDVVSIDLAPWLELLVLSIPFLALWIYRRLMCWLCGLVGDNSEFYGEIRVYNRLLFAMMALIYIPVLLVVMFGGIWFFSLFILLGVLFLFYVERVYKYFRYRGFARLQWFLYLCTVEILPLSVMAGIMLNF